MENYHFQSPEGSRGHIDIYYIFSFIINWKYHLCYTWYTMFNSLKLDISNTFKGKFQNSTRWTNSSNSSFHLELLLFTYWPNTYKKRLIKFVYRNVFRVEVCCSSADCCQKSTTTVVAGQNPQNNKSHFYDHFGLVKVDSFIKHLKSYSCDTFRPYTKSTRLYVICWIKHMKVSSRSLMLTADLILLINCEL